MVAAVLAHPWDSIVDRWLLGVSSAVVVIVFAWWRGQFVTTLLGRRVGVWRRNHAGPKARGADQETVVLRVEDPIGMGLPVALIAGYVDRFGLRCESVRVTSRDRGGVRTTWISVTLNAIDNLAALQARSPQLPLAATAAVVGRRLADNLRESGLEVSIVEDPEGPTKGRESWSGVRDERGVVSAYGVAVDERVADRLAEIWAQPSETWTALEFSGTASEPTVAALCALRSTEAARRVPLPGLITYKGGQGPLVSALAPGAPGCLGIATTPLVPDVLDRLTWPVGDAADFSRT
jgi:type VII secretion protein EccE